MWLLWGRPHVGISSTLDLNTRPSHVMAPFRCREHPGTRAYVASATAARRISVKDSSSDCLRGERGGSVTMPAGQFRWAEFDRSSHKQPGALAAKKQRPRDRSEERRVGKECR